MIKAAKKLAKMSFISRLKMLPVYAKNDQNIGYEENAFFSPKIAYNRRK
jgi:hypothetical protein